MSLKLFRQEIDKGFPSPIYLFCSTESFLLYEALLSIKEFYKDSAFFDMEIIDLASDEENVSAKSVIDILYTLPFMGSKRVVALRNLQKWNRKEAQKFCSYLKNPSESARLFMMFEGSKQDVFDADSMKQVKTISLKIAEEDIPEWVKEKAEKMNVKFSYQAIQTLISMVGVDLGMLNSEIEKFSMSHYGRVVDSEDIKKIVYAGIEYDAFDLVKALMRKDSAEVFRIFQNISNTVDPSMLLGALNWQYSALMSKGSLKDMNPDKTKKIFTLLHEADMAVKRSHSHVVEDLLVKLMKL